MRLRQPKLIIPAQGQGILDFEYSPPNIQVLEGIAEYERQGLNRVLAHETVGRKSGNNERTARAWEIAGHSRQMSNAQLATALHDLGARYQQLLFDETSALAIGKTNTKIHADRQAARGDILQRMMNMNPDDPETIRFILETMPDRTLAAKFIEMGYKLSTLPVDELIPFALAEELTTLQKEQLDYERNFETYKEYLHTTRRWIFVRILNRMICGRTIRDAISMDEAQRKGNIQDVIDSLRGRNSAMKSTARRIRKL